MAQDMTSIKEIFKFWEEILNRKVIITQSATEGLLKTFELISKKYLPQKKYVILPVMSHPSIIRAIIKNNLVPVFVDINKTNLNIDQNALLKILSKIYHKTASVIIVGMFGYVDSYKKIKEITARNNIFLVEDASQSFLREKGNCIGGNIGDISIVSLSHPKIFSAPGKKLGIILYDKNVNLDLYKIKQSHFDLRDMTVIISKIKKRRSIFRKLRKINEIFYANISKSGFQFPLLDYTAEEFVIFNNLKDKLKKYLLKSGVSLEKEFPLFTEIYKLYDEKLFKNANYYKNYAVHISLNINMSKEDIHNILNCLISFNEKTNT